MITALEIANYSIVYFGLFSFLSDGYVMLPAGCRIALSPLIQHQSGAARVLLLAALWSCRGGEFVVLRSDLQLIVIVDTEIGA